MNTLRKHAILAVVGLLLLSAAATLGYCARDHRARQEAAQAARTADAAALGAAGALAAERVSREQAEAELGGTRAEVERLKKAVPGTEVVEVLKWKTETIHAGETPLPDPANLGAGRPTFGGATTAAHAVLRLGDPFRVEVTEVTLETANGAKAITGRAEVIRETAPEASLGAGKIAIDVSKYLVAPSVAQTTGDDDRARALYGGGLGVADGLGGVVPMASGIAVGKPIKKTAWRLYVTGAIGLSTVRVGNEERRPAQVFAGFVR